MLFYLSIVLIASTFLAILLTPAVYDLIFFLWPEVPWPFSRVLDRVFLLAIIVLLIVFRKKLTLKEIAERYNFLGWQNLVTRVGVGILLAITTSMVVLFMLLSQGTISVREFEYTGLLIKFLKVLVAALLIAVMEESFFRLLVLSGIRKLLPVLPAILVASLIYACLHFVAPDKRFVFESGNYLQGFHYAQVVFSNAWQSDLTAPFIGLLLIGILLNSIMLKCKTILFCIGLHAGWIIVLKLTKYCFTINVELPQHVLASRYFLVGQPLVWGSFIVVALVVALLKWRGFFDRVDLR